VQILVLNDRKISLASKSKYLLPEEMSVE
jgi:hypothetical protein